MRVARLASLSSRKRTTMEFISVHLASILRALQQFELTPWKMVGFTGTLLFTSRWFVQLYYTRKYKRVVMPLAFWTCTEPLNVLFPSNVWVVVDTAPAIPEAANPIAVLIVPEELV